MANEITSIKPDWSGETGLKFHAEVIMFIDKKINSGEKVIDFTSHELPTGFGSIEGKKNLAGIDLSSLKTKEFTDCELRNCIFNEGNLSNFRFSNVKLVDVTFKETNLQDAFIYNTEILSGTILDEANLKGAQIKGLIGLCDKSLQQPFIYSAPPYQIILLKCIYANYSLEKYTLFDSVDTKDVATSINKELKEYIHWYQKLTIRLAKKGLRNRIGIFLQVLTTKYWTSFFALVVCSIVFNASMGKLITYYNTFFKFKYPTEINWDWFDGFYYCIVTFTTLGYGDVTPVNHSAQFAAAVVALVGYFTLGMAVYLMSKKIDKKF